MCLWIFVYSVDYWTFHVSVVVIMKGNDAESTSYKIKKMYLVKTQTRLHIKSLPVFLLDVETGVTLRSDHICNFVGLLLRAG